MMPMPRAAGDPIVPISPATTLDYEQSSQLMNDMTFRGRVKVSCLNYAQYISLEPSDTPAHNSRYKWAQNCFQSPDAVANQITQACVLNPNVQQAGSAVTDQALDGAVQATVNSIM